MMCANYGCLGEEVRLLEDAGADILHIDVMDGHFVPNFGMGLQDIEFITDHARIPVDVHLMIDQPGHYIEKFALMGISIMYVHLEADQHITRTLQSIKDHGMKAGIAINPGTSIEAVKPILSLVDYMLVMSVNPGFAGQKYLPFVDEKIDGLHTLKDKYHFSLMLDGSCSPERIKILRDRGVDGFILGTSALFGKDRPYKELIRELRY